MSLRPFLAGVALVAAASPALAHSGHDSQAGGFVSGFTHPLMGLDHIAAMLAIGLWAAVLGGKAFWKVPVAFVGAMLVGFLLARAGVHLPGVEPGIAASVLVLGLLTAARVRLPLAAAASLAGVFAIFHGHAHGTEVSGGALEFGLGFVLATVLLHAAGLWLGMILTRERPMLARGVGAVVAGVGVLVLGGLA